MEFANY